MTIKELYHHAILLNEPSLILLIDFLVKEKQVLTLQDDTSKLDYYFQDKFQNKMNQYLVEYGGMKG